MRKIFANLKSVVALAVVAAMTLSVSCMYDDTALTKRVSKVEKELAALTERVNALQNNESINDLLNGAAVITGYAEDEAGNVTLTLSNGKTVTVLAEGLQYRVTDGVLEISADGTTWVAVTAAPDAVVKKAVVNEDGSVTITLADDTEFTVAKAELIECEATRSQVYVIAGTTKAVRFTINDAVEDINVMNQPFGWSATVEEYVEVEEDDFGGGIAPLAVGGKEYVLNITGPATKLVDEGLAAKEGVVSVHFNTAAGACKVMNVAVNLAELTLSIDNAGNITLNNTVATEQTNYFGEKFTDFADFWIGYMPKSDYLAFLAGEDYDPYSVVYTQRSTGFGNFIDLMQYVEGECEKETYTFTLDQYIQGVFYGEPVAVGSEYVVFVTIEHDGYYEPELSKAVTVEYKKTIVEASVVEGSATWNDATLNLSLAGYNMYRVGWMSVDEFNMLNEGLGAASFEEFLPTWLGADMNYMRGVVIGQDMIDVNYTISELAMYGGASVLPGTEYYLFVYPFNAQTEMELYQHQVIAENIVFCGTFETAALKAGQFEASAEYTNVEHFEDSISVDVEFTGDAATIVYNWINEPSIDPASTIAQIFADYYTQYVDVYEGKAEFNASHSPYDVIPNPIYLAMIVINANGEYVYLEKEFTYIEPEPIALTSFEYQGRHLDIDDNPETSGGDHVYIAKAVDGTELTIGLYYTYADENGVITPGEYDYCANYFDAMYSSWNGFVIVSDTRYYNSKLIVTEDTVKIKIKGGNIYLFDKNAAPVEPDQPEVYEPSASAALVTDTTFGGFNPYDVTFSFENGDKVLARFNTSGNQYLHLGAWQNDSYQDPHFLSFVKLNGDDAYAPACNVAYENGVYTVTMSVYEYTNYTTTEYTYTGAIEGLNAPEACDCIKEPEQPDQPEQPEGGDDADWADAIVLTSVAHAGYGGSVGDYGTQYAHHYLLSDESGNNTVKLCSCDYDFAQQVADAGTYTFVDPYVAGMANDDEFKFSAYELVVNGVAVGLNYEGEGSLVITKTGDYVHTFKFAVPGADGNTYKFVAENVSWNVE